MKIDVSNLFNGDSKPIKIDYTLDLEDLVYSTYNPIKDGAKVRGSVYEKANVVFLDTEVSFKFYGFCDRCAEKVIKDMSFPVKKILVPKLANDADADFDEYVVVPNGILDLNEFITEEIQLFYRQKFFVNLIAKVCVINAVKTLTLEIAVAKKTLIRVWKLFCSCLMNNNKSY